jgi:hypothetical protein
MPRTLVETTATHRRYRVTNGSGKVVGEDLEPIATPVDTNEAAVRQAALAYLSITNPSAPQTSEQVKRLSRIVLGDYSSAT